MTSGQKGHQGYTLEAKIEPVIEEIKIQTQGAASKHLDETGLRIEGKTNWLHVVATNTLTWYRVSRTRSVMYLLLLKAKKNQTNVY